MLGANNIKNSLASLESLGMELIPAITDFYLHLDNKEKQTSVKLLTDEWQTEIKKFHNTVFLIIDSSAYCQVRITIFHRNYYMKSEIYN